MNTTGSKTPTTFSPFHTDYDYMDRLLINEDLFLDFSLQNTMYDLKTLLPLCLISKLIQLILLICITCLAPYVWLFRCRKLAW